MELRWALFALLIQEVCLRHSLRHCLQTLRPDCVSVAGAAQEIVFSTFEGIAVKLKDSGQFGVVRSVQGGLATVAIGTEDTEKGVVLGDAPASVMVVSNAPKC